MGKIVSITEKTPVSATLPDGNYVGIWGGNIIELKYNNKTYELETEVGVRGIGYHVVVIVKDGEATFQELKN
jgi:hypothetical protein